MVLSLSGLLPKEMSLSQIAPAMAQSHVGVVQGRIHSKYRAENFMSLKVQMRSILSKNISFKFSAAGKT